MLKLQYFGHLMKTAHSLEKTLIWERLRAGGEKGWMGSPTQRTRCVCLATQSCPNFCDPMDYSLPDSSALGDSPGKDIGVGCHTLSQGDPPHPGIKSRSPLPSEPPGKLMFGQIQGDGEDRAVWHAAVHWVAKSRT